VHERERWQVIKALLRERSLVRIADACRATGASEASVRRDFASLAEQGVAIRVHGGLEALPEAADAQGDVVSLATRAFDVSQTLNIDAKRAIAKAAVGLCADGISWSLPTSAIARTIPIRACVMVSCPLRPFINVLS